MEENTTRRRDAELLKQLRIQKRQCHHLFELVDICMSVS